MKSSTTLGNHAAGAIKLSYIFMEASRHISMLDEATEVIKMIKRLFIKNNREMPVFIRENMVCRLELSYEI